MKLRKIICILICLALAVSLCACNPIDSGTPVVSSTVEPDSPPVREPYPVSVYGAEVSDVPTAVVSLSPAVTKILADLNVGRTLVGISDYCSLPGFEVPSAGSPADPNLEKIAELKPRLVITLSPMASTDKISLAQQGISVMEIPNPESYAELCDIYINLAKVFYGNVDYREPAHDALLPLDSALSQIEELNISKSFICIEEAMDGGFVVAGGETLDGDLLGVFGENLLPSMGTAYVEMELLELLEPRVIFAYNGVDREDIRDCFEEEKIVFIPEKAISQPSASLGEILLQIAEELK